MGLDVCITTRRRTLQGRQMLCVLYNTLEYYGFPPPPPNYDYSRPRAPREPGDNEKPRDTLLSMGDL